MNKDVRIDVGFLTHPKTVKLKRRLGSDAVLSLVALWLWSAQNRPDGELTGMDREDLEIVSDWPGDDGIFVDTLTELKWIDEHDGCYRLHDWTNNNPWVAKSMDRSDEARFMRLARTDPELYRHLKDSGVTSISKQYYAELTSRKRSVALEHNVSSTPAPAPAPAPAPVPKEKEKDIAPTVSENRNGSKPPSPPKIFLDEDFQWQNIDESHLSTWSEAYPACDVRTELIRSALYIRAHPNKRKKNWERYIIGWFGRAQEWGGTKGKCTDSWDIDAWANEKDSGVQ